MWVDDFYMFRYELQTINRKNLYLDERHKNDMQMFGQQPLSRYEGIPVKDLLKDMRKGGDQNKKGE